MKKKKNGWFIPTKNGLKEVSFKVAVGSGGPFFKLSLKRGHTVPRIIKKRKKINVEEQPFFYINFFEKCVTTIQTLDGSQFQFTGTALINFYLVKKHFLLIEIEEKSECYLPVTEALTCIFQQNMPKEPQKEI